MAMSLENIEKRGHNFDFSRIIGSYFCTSAPRTLSFHVKIAKISPADLEIICLRKIIKKDKTTKCMAKPSV